MKYIPILYICMLFIVRLYYGPACVERWETDKVYYKLGYVLFTDNSTGNTISMMGTWTVEEIKK